MSERKDLRIGSLAAYVAWGLRHQAEIKAIIANVQIMMADFPQEPTAPAPVTPGGPQLPSFMVAEQADDSALRQSIMALPDGQLDIDNAVLNQLLDTTDAEQLKLGDGTFIKMFLENLPAILEAIKLLMAMFPKEPPAVHA